MDDQTLLNKKVFLVIAFQNFHEESFKRVKIDLEAYGAEVLVVSSDIGNATSSAGTHTETDLSITEMDIASSNAVVFIGGPGVSSYFNDTIALQAIKEAAESGKVLGALCEAPMILANAGVLRAKRATGFSSLAGKLKEAGVDYVTENVEVDGKIVTAADPKYAKEFTERLAQLLM